QTAVQIATDAIDRLHTTAESHNRVIVVEVMGRHAGWIATYSGMAGGADAILVPERPFDIDDVCDHPRRRHPPGRPVPIVVAAGRFGQMVALRGTEIVLAPLDEAVAAPKLLDPALYETAAVFFG